MKSPENEFVRVLERLLGPVGIVQPEACPVDVGSYPSYVWALVGGSVPADARRVDDDLAVLVVEDLGPAAGRSLALATPSPSTRSLQAT